MKVLELTKTQEDILKKAVEARNKHIEVANAHDAALSSLIVLTTGEDKITQWKLENGKIIYEVEATDAVVVKE